MSYKRFGKSFGVRLTPDIEARAEAAAAFEGKPVTMILREAVERGIAAVERRMAKEASVAAKIEESGGERAFAEVLRSLAKEYGFKHMAVSRIVSRESDGRRVVKAQFLLPDDPVDVSAWLERSIEEED